jgi:phenylpyruvate tautomerase PptA (4-oxalocrotonate tautomerase family)
MCFIQCDLEVGLSDEKKVALVKKMTDITHKAIGSPYRHINVVLREHSASNIGEAGEAGRALDSKRNAKRISSFKMGKVLLSDVP